MTPPVIWIASYPRSGNTWFRFLLSSYFFGEGETWFHQDLVVYALQHLINRDKSKSREQVFEEAAAKAEGREDRHGLTNELVFKTHWRCDDDHPYIDRTTKAIYLVRDPRDVLLSAANYMRLRKLLEGVSDAEYARGFIERGGDRAWIREGYGTWAEHTRSWLDQDRFPVHLVQYERLKEQPAETLGAVIDFIGWPRDDERLAAAAGAASFDRLRSLEMQAREQRSTNIAKASADHRFIHKGASGQSLEHLGRDVVEEFERVFAEPARRFGYDLSGAHTA